MSGAWPQVFKDNGYGVRGDLASVTRAILLDPEARGARKIDLSTDGCVNPSLLDRDDSSTGRETDG